MIRTRKRISFRQQKDGRGLKFWRSDGKTDARFPDSGRLVKLKKGDAVGHIACCDCGLVHEMRWIIRPGYVRLTAWRDERTTRRYRKQENIRVRVKR